MTENTSRVYFVEVADNEPRASIEEKLQRLCQKAEIDTFIEDQDIVAIKTHFGEKGNTTHIKADFIKKIVEEVKLNGGTPYLTETSVLYKSPRSNALSHILLAYDHGFTYENVGAPIILADGFLGNWEKKVEINGDYYKEVSVAGDSLSSDKLLVVSHVTGHILSGIGAAFKNLGMGLSSRKGKLDQHSQVAPKVKQKECDFCKTCIKWCPEDAIRVRNEKAFIDPERCIGCGECIAVCKPGAVKFSWNSTSEILQKKMVEHAYGIYLEQKDKLLFINFLIDMTKDCDCMVSEKKLVGDIGILASYDPVAIDMASLDITVSHHAENISKLSYPQHDPLIQIEHAVKLGMGDKTYRLEKI